MDLNQQSDIESSELQDQTNKSSSLVLVAKWFTECLQSLKRKQNENSQFLNSHFLYKDIDNIFHYLNLDKNNRCSPQLLTTLLAKRDTDILLKKSFDLILEQEIKKPHEASVYNSAYRSRKKFFNIVVIQQKFLEDKNMKQQRSLHTFLDFLSLQDKFNFIMFHELGHSYQVKKQLEKTIRTDYEIKADFRYQKGSENIQNLLRSYLEYEEVRMRPTLVDKFTLEFEKQGLTPKEIIAFYQFHKSYFTLQKEMYADCFACLMFTPSLFSQDQEQPQDIINYTLQVATSRVRYISRAHFINPKEAQAYEPVEHYTTPALHRLIQLIGQRRIETEELQEDEIHDLCQEASVYGFIHFLKECCLTNPKYEKFLNVLSVKNQTPSLFDNLATDLSVPSKNKTHNYTLSQLFSEVLEPTDISFSQEKAHLTHTIYHILHSAQNTIANPANFDITEYLTKHNLTQRSLSEVDFRLEDWQQMYQTCFENATQKTMPTREEQQLYFHYLAQKYASDVIEYKKYMAVRASRIFQPYLNYDENGVDYPKEKRAVEQMSLFDKIQTQRSNTEPLKTNPASISITP